MIPTDKSQEIRIGTSIKTVFADGQDINPASPQTFGHGSVDVSIHNSFRPRGLATLR
jgi:hypothetical protein